MADLKLVQDPETGFYDLVLGANGDLETVESFDTSLVVSLFSDQRADASEVSLPQFRRGWWGDTVQTDLNLKIGSKLWLLEQARMTNVILNKCANYARLSLDWLVTNQYSIKVDTRATFIANGIALNIKITNKNGQTQNKAYKLWSNTGNLTNGN